MIKQHDGTYFTEAYMQETIQYGRCYRDSEGLPHIDQSKDQSMLCITPWLLSLPSQHYTRANLISQKIAAHIPKDCDTKEYFISEFLKLWRLS